MKSFLTRAISAVVAVFIVFILYYFFDKNGFKILITFGVIVGSWELTNILFKDFHSRSNKIVFHLLLMLVYFLSSFKPQFSGVIFSFFSIGYFLFSLLAQKKFENLDELSRFQAKSVMGFFYMGLIPSFMNQILDLPNGMIWFTSLLSIVLAGDVGAYLVGMALGKRKIMPLVSPKKTVEGSIGGICFSLIAAMICSYFLPHISLWAILLLAIITSVVAQFGDFFESVLKRVADIKDSGTLIPGHGGILDRIDGVLFAAPIVLFGALVLEKLV